MNNENNNQVQGFNGVNQPYDNNGQYMNNQPMNNNQMMQQPMYNQQPMNNRQMMQQPMYNQQPMNNNQMMQQPMYNQQPMNNGQMMQQPMYNQQPMNNGQMMQQPMYNQQPMNNGQMMYQQPMNNKMGGNKKNIGLGIVAFVVGFVVVYFIVTSLGGSKAIKGAWNCNLDGSPININIKDDKNIELTMNKETIKGTYTKASYKVKKEYKKSGYSYKLLKIEANEYSYGGTSRAYSQHLELLIGVKGKEAHLISVGTDGTIHQGTCKK